MLKAGIDWGRRRAPELTLAAFASVVFLAFLGSVDIWGKREQRASAEAIDTVQNGHWLVAQIQGRPRLEKPPLPRWTIAALIMLTGRQDEWIVRLPSALSALGMVALVYALGCRLGDRSVGLAAGLVLSSFVFFISELRQAGNDGPLALFTTLALYAAWRRLHGGQNADGTEQAGARGWAILMYAALGLGFLTKGPIVVILVALTLVPYLVQARRFRAGLRSLLDWRGILLFLFLALSWPVPVLMGDVKAAEVWYLEMAQKAGSAGIQHHRVRTLLALDWPAMTAPWLVVATVAVVMPMLPRGRSLRAQVWFPWWWAVGNLAMLCFWKVAKPNYYIPCLPGAALLTAIAWVRMARAAREPGTSASPLRMLQLHWLFLFAAALAAPVVVQHRAPQYLGWALTLSGTLSASVAASVWALRRGADAGSLAPIAATLAATVLSVYGVIGPADNPTHSHRALAATLDRLFPAEQRTIMFFHELDEGLWFYLRNRNLQPVPGSQPKYNDALELVDEFRENHLVWDRNERLKLEKGILLDWLRNSDGTVPYLLIRSKVLDLFGAELNGLALPVYRERGLKRNELVLLRVVPQCPVATGQSSPGSTLR